jgi:hypothetical protein
MAFHTVLKMTSCRVRVGGIVQPAGPTWSAWVEYKCSMKGAGGEVSVASVDVAGACEDREINQPTKLSGSVSIDLLCKNTGLELHNFLGHYIEVELKPESSLASGTLYKGFIEKHAFKLDDPNMESVTVKLGANGN